MPIPDFDHNGVLPPHVGNHAGDRGRMSPYPCTSVELSARLAATDARRQILAGLLELRGVLRQLGVTSGFQWLDGSFVEDAENTRGRAPNDIDVVTFALLPPALPLALPPALAALVPVLTDRDATKARFHVDHILVPLRAAQFSDASRLVDDARYWYGLFSHRRNDDVWKGMLQLPLDTEAEDAIASASLRGTPP